MSAVIADHKKENHSSLANYIVGYVLSVLLTVCAYLVVTRHLFTTGVMFGIIASLAVLQFMVQLLCFLHLGAENKPRWKQLVFWCMIMVVIVVVGGSIWIMANLDYNMTQAAQNKYLEQSDSL
jgi:cytochrome o ubiquinol oxidase operon protein cyoD